MFKGSPSITALVLFSLTISLSGCGEDEEGISALLNVPISFAPDISQGDYSVRITITAPDMDPITKTQNLDIQQGIGQTYEIVVYNIPVGSNRNVKVEISKDGKVFFEGSEVTHLSSGGGNNAFIMLERNPMAFPLTDTRIAFTSSRSREGNNDIYVMNADGTNEKRLTQTAAGDSHPSWSPDGTKIAFTSSRKDNVDIYVMNANGTGQKRLTQTAADDSYPSWSPDGTQIAFMSDRDGSYEIYVMNTSGTGQNRLPGHGLYPSWSPDGTKIAFTSSRKGNTDIYVMNADGTNEKRLTQAAAGDLHPSWSPDGTKIAFTSSRKDNVDIYVMNANGTDQKRLTQTAADDLYPSWSPDGTQIAFMSNRDGSYEIYVMNTSGTGQERLPGHGMYPSWAPFSLAAPAAR